MIGGAVAGSRRRFTIPAAPVVIGSTTPNSSTSIAIPAHQVGDLIIISDCTVGSTTAATKPSAGGTVPTWTNIDAPAGANSRYQRTVYAVATATNHTSGSWNFCSGMVCVVVRGQAASGFIGGHSLQHNTSSTNCTAAAITPTRTDGSSLILCINAGGGTSILAAPAGYTRISNGAGYVWAVNTKDSSTSDGSVIQTYGNTGANSAAQIEICSY